jgi:hypothetical protein
MHRLLDHRMGGRRGRPVLLVLVAVLTACCFSTVSEAGTGAPQPVLVKHGSSKQYRWKVFVGRDAGRMGGQRSCLTVVLLDTKPEGLPEPGLVRESYSTVCAVLGATRAPNFVSVVTGEEGPKQYSINVLLVAPAVRSIRLERKDERALTLTPRPLSPDIRKRAGVRPAAVAAFSSRGVQCFGRMTLFNKIGAELFSAPPEPCFEQ